MNLGFHGKQDLHLFLVRHGEAVLHQKGDDFERKLTERGIHQATWLGKRIGLAEISLVLVSKAARTMETAQILLSSISKDECLLKLRESNEVYMAKKDSLLKLILSVGKASSPKKIMVVGHNPGLSLVAQYLTGQDISMGTADLYELVAYSPSWEEALCQEGAWKVAQQLDNPC